MKKQSPLAQQIRRRREAALRCPPMADGRRDPMDAPSSIGPSTYGLTQAELQLHAAELISSGWSVEEVLQRLLVPAPPAVACPCAPAAAPQLQGSAA